MIPARARELIRLAFGGIRRRPLRVILTTLGVSIGTGALISMVGFALGLQGQMESSISQLQVLNQIEVSAGENALDDAALDRLRAIPGVLTAYPQFRIQELQVVHAEHSLPAVAASLPPNIARLGLLDQILAAGRFMEEEADEAVVSARLVDRIGFESVAAAVGQPLVLNVGGLTPAQEESFVFERRQLSVRICGVFEPPPFAFGFGGDVVLLTPHLLRDLPGSRMEHSLERLRRGEPGGGVGYSSVTVQVERFPSLEEVQRTIEQQGFETQMFLRRLDEMRTFYLIIDSLLFSVGGVAIIIAGLGIANTLFMSVLERFREIGVFKSMGASDGDVKLLFLVEAGLIGVLGGLGGLLLGRVVSLGLEIGVNRYARSQGLEIDLAAFAFPWWLLATAMGFAVLVSVVSGLIPASRAARVDPIAALRAE